jgi:hypothetical protein
MKTVFTCIIALLVLSSVVLVICLRHDCLRVRQESLCVVTPKYAGNVWSFYEASNRFPNSTTELTEFVFGRSNWVEDYTFSVLDSTQRVFSIGVVVGRSRDIQLQFQLSNTGVVERSIIPLLR